MQHRAGPKYRNHTLLVQGVGRCAEQLDQGERLFLLCLAAHTLKEDPHPGNEILAAFCGITTRRGVNKIANKLVAKSLIEIIEVGNGRGRATVYRLRVDDPRFPPPKGGTKPGTPEFPLPAQKPGTVEFPLPDDAKGLNPEPHERVESAKLGTRPRETRNSRVPHEFKPPNRRQPPNKPRRALRGVTPQTGDIVPEDLWNHFAESCRELRKPLTKRRTEFLLRKLRGFKTAGHDATAIVETAILNGNLDFRIDDTAARNPYRSVNPEIYVGSGPEVVHPPCAICSAPEIRHPRLDHDFEAVANG